MVESSEGRLPPSWPWQTGSRQATLQVSVGDSSRLHQKDIAVALASSEDYRGMLEALNIRHPFLCLAGQALRSRLAQVVWEIRLSARRKGLASREDYFG